MANFFLPEILAQPAPPVATPVVSVPLNTTLTLPHSGVRPLTGAEKVTIYGRFRPTAAAQSFLFSYENTYQGRFSVVSQAGAVSVTGYDDLTAESMYVIGLADGGVGDWVEFCAVIDTTGGGIAEMYINGIDKNPRWQSPNTGGAIGTATQGAMFIRSIGVGNPFEGDFDRLTIWRDVALDVTSAAVRADMADPAQITTLGGVVSLDVWGTADQYNAPGDMLTYDGNRRWIKAGADFADVGGPADEVAGAALVASPSAAGGDLAQAHALPGAALAASPSASGGDLAPADEVAGAAIAAAPSASGGDLAQAHALPGAALVASPSASGGDLAPADEVAGASLAASPSASGGDLAQGHALPGAALAASPSASGGDLAGADSLAGAPLVAIPSASGGDLAQGHALAGAALAASPSASGGAASDADHLLAIVAILPGAWRHIAAPAALRSITLPGRMSVPRVAGIWKDAA